MMKICLEKKRKNKNQTKNKKKVTRKKKNNNSNPRRYKQNEICQCVMVLIGHFSVNRHFFHNNIPVTANPGII